MDMKYGLPDKKKYPMPDRDHVMSAIKFFNYVSPNDEAELARNINKRIREYGIKNINVGEKNRFKKYYKRRLELTHGDEMNSYNEYPENDYRNYLMHYAKGEKAKKHKYLYIDKNDNYVYPEDLIPNAKRKIKQKAKGIKTAFTNAVSEVTSGNLLNKAKTKASQTTQKAKTAVASIRPTNIKRNFYKSTGYDKINAKNIASALRNSIKESSEARKQKKAEKKALKAQQKTDKYNRKLATKAYNRYLNTNKPKSGLAGWLQNRKAKKIASTPINQARKKYRDTGIDKNGSYLTYLKAIKGYSNRDIELRLTRANKAKKRRYKSEKFEAKVAAYDKKEKENLEKRNVARNRANKYASVIESLLPSNVIKKIPSHKNEDWNEIMDLELKPFNQSAWNTNPKPDPNKKTYTFWNPKQEKYITVTKK